MPPACTSRRRLPRATCATGCTTAPRSSRRIPGVRTLAERLAMGELDAAVAARVGRTLAGFHVHGAWHADLNAHNILTDASGTVWLLDFDRGRLRTPAMAWQQANLARLRRSFIQARRRS